MNILTFDIEDWYIIDNADWIGYQHWENLPARVESNIADILEVLAVHQTTATFFVLGWVAEKYPSLVKKIHNSGHEIGYHSYYHTLAENFTAQSFEEDLLKGIDLIRQITKSPVRYFRAPNFSVNCSSSFIYPILARNGIRVSSSVKAFRVINGVVIKNEPVNIATPYGAVLEMPLNRLRLPLERHVTDEPSEKHRSGKLSLPLPSSGSGLFRITPLFVLKSLFSESKYHMTYFHPRDFDPAPPQDPALSTLRNWMNRVNTTTTLPKLSSLLSRHHFTTLGEAAAVYANQSLQHIQVP